MPEPLVIKIDGDLASDHVLPLYEGGETLAGIGLSFTRVAHYLLTSEVRHKAPYDSRLKILTRAPTRGSIEFDFLGFISGPAPVSIIGQITIGVTAAIVFEAGIYLFKKVIGSRLAYPPNSLKPLVEQRPGDIDALASSIVSPAKRAHSVINHGASSTIINGNNNTVILDRETKEYINTTVESDEEFWIDASIGWLNGNQRTGGAFIYEYGRIVPFNLSKAVSVESMQVITKSHSEYFIGNKEKSRISIKVIPSYAIDGTVKRYRLVEASEVDG